MDGVLDPVLLGGEARDQVHLVAARDREQHTRLPHTGLLQHRQRSAVADDSEDVELLRRERRSLGIRFDENHVLVLLGETLRQMETHLAGARDQHSHEGCPRGAWMLRPEGSEGRPKIQGARPLRHSPVARQGRAAIFPASGP